MLRKWMLGPLSFATSDNPCLGHDRQAKLIG